MRIFTIILCIFIALFTLSLVISKEKNIDKEPAETEEIELPEDFLIAPPPFSPNIFPCSQCHAHLPVNTEVRKLEQHHTDIKLNHMPGGWCFTCHNPDNRDKLRLASGRLIDFTESYYLCGQCHGPKFRDWKAGIHGRVTGEWNGQKEYLLCANCHWPHDPGFKPLKPEPPPVRPEDIK